MRLIYNRSRAWLTCIVHVWLFVIIDVFIRGGIREKNFLCHCSKNFNSTILWIDKTISGHIENISAYRMDYFLFNYKLIMMSKKLRSKILTVSVGVIRITSTKVTQIIWLLSLLVFLQTLAPKVDFFKRLSHDSSKSNLKYWSINKQKKIPFFNKKIQRNN